MEDQDPFQQYQYDKPFSIFQRFKGIVRIPILFFLYLVTTFYNTIGSLIPFRLISRIFHRFVSRIFVRLMLFFLHHGNIPQNIVPINDYYSEPNPLKPIKKGDIVISNLSSYIQILWIQSYYSPLFAIPAENNQLSLHSFHEMFLSIFFSIPISNSKNIYSLKDAVDKAISNYCPLFVFPEGAVSNGTSVLSFLPFECPDYTVHILGFDTPPPIAFVCGSPLNHLVRIAGNYQTNFQNSRLRVFVMDHSEIPPSSQGQRKLLSQMLRIPLSKQGRKEYLEHLNSQNKKFRHSNDNNSEITCKSKEHNQ